LHCLNFVKIVVLEFDLFILISLNI